VKLQRGANVDGELLRAKAVRCLRSGEKNGWLEITLDEGRNRQIRRLLSAFDTAVLRLIRVCIGDLKLGQLPKGGWRAVTEHEIESLGAAARPTAVTAKTR
jgi:23S rRNA pseudouridine2605 synthase